MRRLTIDEWRPDAKVWVHDAILIVRERKFSLFTSTTGSLPVVLLRTMFSPFTLNTVVTAHCSVSQKSTKPIMYFLLPMSRIVILHFICLFRSH